MCKCNDNKYGTSCIILEGCECCRCCNIIDCQDSVCPVSERITEKPITMHEFRKLNEVCDILNALGIIKADLLRKKTIDSYRLGELIRFVANIKSLEKDIKVDSELSVAIKNKSNNLIKVAKACKSDLMSYATAFVKKDRKYLKRTKYNYIRRNIGMYKNSETIWNDRVLVQSEQFKLIKLMKSKMKTNEDNI